MTTITKQVQGFVYTKRVLKVSLFHKESNQIEPMISTKKTKTPQPKKRKSGRVSMRGKRVSEAYNGLCPVPHPDIPTNSYYSFIDTEVSDPLRMRQLLLWCSLKTAETYPFEDDVEIKKIQQKVIQALANKTLNTSWYHNEKLETKKQPHPNNIENQKKIEIFEAQIKRYRQEIQEWKEIVEYYEQEHVQHQQQRQEIILNSTDVMDYVEKEHLEFLKLAKETTKKVDDLIEKVNENTPYQRYLVQHKLHSSQCVYEELHRDTELLYSKMLKASAERDRKEFVDPATVLSLISKS